MTKVRPAIVAAHLEEAGDDGGDEGHLERQRRAGGQREVKRGEKEGGWREGKHGPLASPPYPNTAPTPSL